MTVPTPRDPVRQGRSVEERLLILESRGGIPGRLTDMGRGTTAERDIYYTVPTTAAQRIELANREVTWFNTDLGWEESYYATTGQAGLTAVGLVAGSDVREGWYPTGLGPEILVIPSAAYSATTNTVIGGWDIISRQRGGNSWLMLDPVGLAAGRHIRAMRAGIYDVLINETGQPGSGIANLWLAHWNALGNVYIAQQGYPMPLNASFYESRHMEFKSHLAREGEFFGEVCNSGVFAVHQGTGAGVRGQFLVRYMAPPLVNG